MDSLLAYGSSDDEQDEEPQKPHHHHSQPTSAKSQGLPKPSSSLFSILPLPKSQMTTPLSPNLNPDPKRVVQFRPPQILISHKEEDDDSDHEEEKEEPKRQLGHVTSVKSFLSTIPAPKNSGTAALGSSAGRRAVIDAPSLVAPDELVDSGLETRQESSNVDVGSSDGYNYEMGYGSYGGAEVNGVGNDEYQSYEPQNYDGGSKSWNFDSNAVYSEGMGPESSSGGVGASDFIGMSGGKRRRDLLPADIVEVKQDELLKNRPTEDKSKLTGIAFGPSYQPASSKGKPSKLSKRKHQISSLYFDMKQKEMELSERRAKGFLTKAETQAKYGW